MQSLWTFVSGKDVEDEYESQNLSDLVPKCEAIYLWRRQLSAPWRARRNAEEFMRWLDRLMQLPIGEISNRTLSHFAVLKNLTIQSPGLTDSKRQYLARLAATPEARRWLVRYVQQLAQFAPPLYCGEAVNLERRTHDHLSADTHFGQQVRSGMAPPWSELELAYYKLGPRRDQNDGEAKKRRTLFEMITTNFGIAGYVERPG